jgi:predicted DNA-binding transcriptional regulator AlpA
VDIRGLSRLLSRSVASLWRDDAAGRLPAAVRIGASKRWRVSEITDWIAAGCPPRGQWQALRDAAKHDGQR